MGGLEPPQFIQPADFKSAASTIPPHPRNIYIIILIIVLSILLKLTKLIY